MKKRYTKSEIFYFCAYAFWFMLSVLELTKISSMIGIYHIVLSVEKPVIIMLLVLKILEDKEYSKKEIIVFAISAVVVLCSYKKSGIEYIFWTACFAMTMKNVKFSDILKITIVIQSVIMCLTFYMVGNGKIEDGIYGNLVWDNTVIQSTDSKRHALGYVHPNGTSAILFFLTIMCLCLKKNIRCIEIVIGVLLNYLLYMKTGSRTSLLLAVTFLPLMWYITKRKVFSRLLKQCFVIASVVIPIIALCVQIFYDPSNAIFFKLNQILSGRIGLGHNGFFEFGPTLFGQSIVFVTDTSYKLVDCAYMYVLLLFGIIFYLFFSFGCYFTMKRLVKEGKRKLCVAFLAWLVFGMIEAVILMISYEPFCLLLGQTVKLEEKKNV